MTSDLQDTPMLLTGKVDIPVRLLALPNEILLIVIDCVSPEDVESFTRTCKTIHGLSVQRLALHRRLKQEYSEIRLGANDDPTYRIPVCFFDELVSNPDLVFYPTSLTLAQYEPKLWPGYEEHRKICDAILRKRHHFSHYLSGDRVLGLYHPRLWHASTLSHDALPLYTLLLTLLPNLQNVIYDGFALRCYNDLNTILDSVLHAKQKQRKLMRALKKLKSVMWCKLPRRGHVLRTMCNPLTPGIWTQFRSLRSLSIDMEHFLDYPLDIEWLNKSRLPHLELIGCTQYLDGLLGLAQDARTEIVLKDAVGDDNESFDCFPLLHTLRVGLDERQEHGPDRKLFEETMMDIAEKLKAEVEPVDGHLELRLPRYLDKTETEDGTEA